MRTSIKPFELIIISLIERNTFDLCGNKLKQLLLSMTMTYLIHSEGACPPLMYLDFVTVIGDEYTIYSRVTNLLRVHKLYTGPLSTLFKCGILM